jgi:hypothetical protein
MPLTAAQNWVSDEEREDVIQEARKREQKGKIVHERVEARKPRRREVQRGGRSTQGSKTIDGTAARLVVEGVLRVRG